MMTTRKFSDFKRGVKEFGLLKIICFLMVFFAFTMMGYMIYYFPYVIFNANQAVGLTVIVFAYIIFVALMVERQNELLYEKLNKFTNKRRYSYAS